MAKISPKNFNKRKFKIQNQRFQHFLQRKINQRRRRKFIKEENKNSIHYKKNSMQMEANLFGSSTSDGCSRKRFL
jgi:hypothetical protein